MMIKDLDVAHEMSCEEQAAVHGGAVTQSTLGLNLNGDSTLIAQQFGIGNVAVLVDTPVQLNLGVNVGQNIAPTINVAPNISAAAGILF